MIVSFRSLRWLFFLILLHPPRSTLFPYTTLFRSALTMRSRIAAASSSDSVRSGERKEAARAIDFRDRKSTRLNSSHGYISYAVFCLKKKKHHTSLSRSADRQYLCLYLQNPLGVAA